MVFYIYLISVSYDAYLKTLMQLLIIYDLYKGHETS